MFSNMVSPTNFSMTKFWYIPLQGGGGRIEKLELIFCQKCLFLLLGKVNKFHFTTFTLLKVLDAQKKTGAQTPITCLSRLL